MKCDVLVIGGGFGGATFARHFEKLTRPGHRKVVLVSQQNFLLFAPMLPEAASGTIEPRHCVIPLREMLDRTDVMVGEVVEFDPMARTAVAVDESGRRHELSFRTALVSPGSIPQTFPIPGLLEHAVGFKTLADAIWLRNRVLHQLELASSLHDDEERRAALTFTFVGGGYAGVEALAELESLARDAVKRYPSITAADVRWVLIEAADSLLPGLDERLASFSDRNLRKRGVEVHLRTKMTSCTENVVVMNDDPSTAFRSETIVWTAGQRPDPVVGDWGLPLTDKGAIPVDDTMAVQGLPGIFAVGDIAEVPDPEGGIAPNTAQHALREAQVAAENVLAHLDEDSPTRFTYKTRGLAVTLGKWQGTAHVKGFTFTGPLAWWMGRSYHLLMMPGLGRKARVVFDWTIGLFFHRDIAQLGELGSPTPLEE
jgi:NADH dehydrogenase